MDFTTRQLARHAVKGYFRVADPSLASESEISFDDICDELERPGGHEGAGIEYLPIPFPPRAETPVAMAVWVALNFGIEVLGRNEAESGQRLDEIQRILAERTTNAVMVRQIRRRAEEWLRDHGHLLDAMLRGRTSTDREPESHPHGAQAEPAQTRRETVTPTTRKLVARTDLVMIIRPSEYRGERCLLYELTAADSELGLNFRRFYSPPFKQDPAKSVAELFVEIENLPVDGAQKPQFTESRMSDLGVALCRKLFPADLQHLLSSLRDRVVTLQVQSDEPNLPWELIKIPASSADGRAGFFLCEGFAIARWVPGLSTKEHLPLTPLALVMPESSELRDGRAEKEELLRLLQPRCRVVPIPARYLRVKDGLASGLYRGWHFIGHGMAQGSNPDRWNLHLDNRETLSPTALSDLPRHTALAQTLVFLNACQSGRAGFALTGLGGWPHAFLEAGAGAFIGCHWAVPDEAARHFALAFYKAFLAGRPIAEALRDARSKLKSLFPGDPTWLAYTLFSHPGARIR